MIAAIGGLSQLLPRMWKSRPGLLARQKATNLRNRYVVWRLPKSLEQWFKVRNIQRLNIGDYKRAVTNRNSTVLTTFSFMELRQPGLTPRLNDYLVANAIETLATKGKLLRLPHPNLGGSYSSSGSYPAEAETWNVVHNRDNQDVEKEERKWEERRCCIECHYWPVTQACPRHRYAFQHWETTEGNTTQGWIKPLLNDAVGDCERCWERDGGEA